MSLHVEPNRLYESCRGTPLDEYELLHLSSCELCQALLAFFEEHLSETNSPSKAA